MSRIISELGSRELALLTTLAARGKVFTVDEATEVLGKPEDARNVLSRLEQKGWVERLQRGAYLIVPLEAGPERRWSEDALAVGTYVSEDSAAAYWTAARHWDWTTQYPKANLFITSRRRFHRRQEILGLAYRFVRVTPQRYFGISEERTGGLSVRVTDPERTVVDCADRPDLCGGIGEFAEILGRAWPAVDKQRVIEYVRRMKAGTAAKRLGFVLEKLGLEPDHEWLESLRGCMGAGYSMLERGGANTGRRVRRWNLLVNVSGFEDRQ